MQPLRLISEAESAISVTPSFLHDSEDEDRMRSPDSQRTESAEDHEAGSAAVHVVTTSGTSFAVGEEVCKLSHFLTGHLFLLGSGVCFFLEAASGGPARLSPQCSDAAVEHLLHLAKRQVLAYPPRGELETEGSPYRLSQLRVAAEFLGFVAIAEAATSRLGELVRGKSARELCAVFAMGSQLPEADMDAALAEALFTPPQPPHAPAAAPLAADRSLSEHLSSGDPHALAEVLKGFDLPTLRALKGTTGPWRERAREALCDWQRAVQSASSPAALRELVASGVAAGDGARPLEAPIALAVGEELSDLLRDRSGARVMREASALLLGRLHAADGSCKWLPHLLRTALDEREVAAVSTAAWESVSAYELAHVSDEVFDALVALALTHGGDGASAVTQSRARSLLNLETWKARASARAALKQEERAQLAHAHYTALATRIEHEAALRPTWPGGNWAAAASHRGFGLKAGMRSKDGWRIGSVQTGEAVRLSLILAPTSSPEGDAMAGSVERLRRDFYFDPSDRAAFAKEVERFAEAFQFAAETAPAGRSLPLDRQLPPSRHAPGRSRPVQDTSATRPQTCPGRVVSCRHASDQPAAQDAQRRRVVAPAAAADNAAAAADNAAANADNAAANAAANGRSE